MEKDKLILKYDDFILQEHYTFVNESFSLDDIKEYLIKVFKRISKASKEHKKKILIAALTLVMATSSEYSKILNIINGDDFIKSEINSTPELSDILYEKLGFKDANNFKLSQKGWDHIKKSEGDAKNPGKPVLTAYNIGDGRITIGWGHAEPENTSKYKVDQKISKSEAQKLLKEDLKVAADGVRRMFGQWKEEKIDRKITQEMFDALVSISFNSGVGGLRKSEIAKEIKKGNYKIAGEVIKTFNIDPKFPGLKNRRDKESDMFLTYQDSVDLDS